ncbi:MAG: hypothetical protein ACI4IX_01780 [Acutalibacteraceae bacterium]
MKKTVSLLLAVIFAAIAVCTFAVSAFAEPEDTDTPVVSTEGWVDPTEAPSTDAPSTDAPSTDAPSTDAPSSEAPSTDAPSTEASSDTNTTGTTLADDTPVDGGSTTAIDDGTTKAPATTKKPAVVDTVIPSTGSSVLVPAVALLALAAGTVAVIKTKKDN